MSSTDTDVKEFRKYLDYEIDTVDSESHFDDYKKDKEGYIVIKFLRYFT